jgi:hypothetical protein
MSARANESEIDGESERDERGEREDGAPASLDEPTDEALLRARFRALVRQEPLIAVTAAVAVGGLLGGVAFSRAGRLAFAAAAGFVAHELWHREGRLAVNEIVARLAGER